MQICIARKGKFVDEEDGVSWINELLLFANFKITRWQKRYYKKWRHDALPRYDIKFAWFEFHVGLDHNWVEV